MLTKQDILNAANQAPKKVEVFVPGHLAANPRLELPENWVILSEHVSPIVEAFKRAASA